MDEHLPIYELRAPLLRVIAEHASVILHAPTGSGKSTQVPQFLLEDRQIAKGEVIVLQPRRLACRMLAARVARERGVALGGEVGYQIRLEQRRSEATRILFVTEGILLRKMMNDPQLVGVSALVFDEFHERHLFTDLSLGRAIALQQSKRPDLKLVVMSATLDAKSLETVLPDAVALRSEGRSFPVEIEYLKRDAQREVWEEAARALENLERRQLLQEGNVLIFMPGAYEIGRTVNAVRAGAGLDRFHVCALHGDMASAQQDEAVAESRWQKVIVSTNVAETSLTIPGVRVVIDSGLAKIAAFDPFRGINTLLLEKISHASADQRAGRAGRVAPGFAMRLWTELDHQGRKRQELPEVKRLDLAEVVLILKASGVNDLGAFHWIDRPEEVALQQAEQLLKDLGGLDSVEGKITDLGQQMLRYPAHPRFGRMFVEAERLGCRRAVALVAALTQSRSLLVRNVEKQIAARREELLMEGATSDFEVLARAFSFARRNDFQMGKCQHLGIHAAAARQVGELVEQFIKISGANEEEPMPSGEALAKCLLAGFSDHVAVRIDGGTMRCQMTHNRTAELSRESVVRDEGIVVAAEAREVNTRDRVAVVLSLLSPVQEAWISQLFPSETVQERRVVFDAKLKRAVVLREKTFRGLVLVRGRMEEPTVEEAAQALAEEVIAGRLSLPGWDQGVEDWIARVNWASTTLADWQLPRVEQSDREALIAQICHGCSCERDLAKAPVREVVFGWLNGTQKRQLDTVAPEKVELPNGRRVKIDYGAAGGPTIRALIQDLYGVSRDVRIGAGAVPLTIEVLAPNRRPVQVTQSLETFWKDAYPKLKLELKRRYPRHAWH